MNYDIYYKHDFHAYIIFMASCIMSDCVLFQHHKIAILETYQVIKMIHITIAHHSC